jgi:type VI secretion system protein VasJ
MVKVLGKIAEAVRLADANNPLGFQLRRQAAWFFSKMPPHNQGETMIMAPAEEVQASLRNMLGKASWPQLLERAEELMTRFPLWLELQYYAGTSAAMLGDSHQGILHTIMSETMRLDQRLPQLKTLKFNDGSPFATSAARGWVEQLAQQLAGGGGAAADGAAELRSELMKLGGNQFEQGLKVAQLAIEQAGNGREAFRLRLEAAAFCLEAKQLHWCHAFTLGLAEQIDHFQLQDWEPQLCGRVWGLQIQVARELREEGPQWETREHEAMRRLSLSHLTLAGQYPSKPKSSR